MQDIVLMLGGGDEERIFEPLVFMVVFNIILYPEES